MFWRRAPDEIDALRSQTADAIPGKERRDLLIRQGETVMSELSGICHVSTSWICGSAVRSISCSSRCGMLSAAACMGRRVFLS